MKLKKKNINLGKGKKKPQENSSEPSKPRQRSQTRNLLNSRPGLHQKTHFLTNLILISQSKSNKE
jgi:hypothetical protein